MSDHNDKLREALQFTGRPGYWSTVRRVTDDSMNTDDPHTRLTTLVEALERHAQDLSKHSSWPEDWRSEIKDLMQQAATLLRDNGFVETTALIDGREFSTRLVYGGKPE